MYIRGQNDVRARERAAQEPAPRFAPTNGIESATE